MAALESWHRTLALTTDGFRPLGVRRLHGFGTPVILAFDHEMNRLGDQLPGEVIRRIWAIAAPNSCGKVPAGLK